MTDTRADAALVAAHLAGQSDALAAIYDRYGAALYDTAAAMLRDRHDAADVTQDVFLVAAQRLGQLRDHSRLKPWLFAILRNEVYRRSARRTRSVPTDFAAPGVADMIAPTVGGDQGGGVDVAELAELVRNAARGLDPRDQLVLELSVRQGLQGADLADALGVTAEQSYTMVHRMRERVERSMTAFAVSRAGRRECATLAAIVAGDEFTVLVRKRVARHIEQCDTCERTRRRVAPVALVSSAPALAAPAELRDRILGHISAGTQAPATTFDRTGGFPAPLRPTRRWTAPAAAALAVLVGIGGGTLLATTRDDPPSALTSRSTVPSTAAAPSPTDPPAATTVADTAPTSPSTSPTGSTSSSPAPPTTSPAPGDLQISGGLIDLGAGSAGAARLTNGGGGALNWSITGGGTPFRVDRTSGTLAPGAHVDVVASIDRDVLGEGTFEATFQISSDVPGDGALALTVRGEVDNDPVVNIVRFVPPNQVSCRWGDPTVNATISDESAIDSATLSWTGPSGQAGSVAAVLSSSGVTAVPTIGSRANPPEPGTWTFVLSATDSRGNTGTTQATHVILAC
jgi:RNA polymerase sigma factor (sigma-70 family)